MADEWCLVPGIVTEEMFVAGFVGDDRNESWANMLDARPPIPRPVWDAMVERGARAIACNNNLFNDPWESWAFETDAVLRAALNNPRIEGDEP